MNGEIDARDSLCENNLPKVLFIGVTKPPVLLNRYSLLGETEADIKKEAVFISAGVGRTFLILI